MYNDIIWAYTFNGDNIAIKPEVDGSIVAACEYAIIAHSNTLWS